MTNKDIEKAAEEYEDSLTYSSVKEQYDVQKAFEAGAKWRINSVWHDAKEEPKYGEYFLYENVIHAYHVDGIYPSEDEPFVWDYYVKYWGLIRWAYIKDLIPTED